MSYCAAQSDGARLFRDHHDDHATMCHVIIPIHIFEGFNPACRVEIGFGDSDVSNGNLKAASRWPVIVQGYEAVRATETDQKSMASLRARDADGTARSIKGY